MPNKLLNNCAYTPKPYFLFVKKVKIKKIVHKYMNSGRHSLQARVLEQILDHSIMPSI